MNKKHKKSTYENRDEIGKLAIAQMLRRGMTEKEIEETLFRSMLESLEEMAGSRAVEKLKQYTSFQDMKNKGAFDPDNEKYRS